MFLTTDLYKYNINKMTKIERLDWVDLSKGLGIILVVYGHVARGLNSAGLGFDNFRQMDNAIYAFHMPLFFLLSGYFFLKSSKKGIRQYVKSKISTILYPYLVWSLIQILIQFFASNYTNGEIVFNDVFTFFLPRGQFWFLLALFFISIINIVLYNIMGRIGILISSFISLIYYIIGPEIKILDDTIANLLFFNLGIYLYENPFLMKVFIQKRISFFFNAILFFTLELLLFNTKVESNIFNLIIAISGSLFIVQFFSIKNIKFNHLKEIGNQSMIIYILHILVASGSRIILVKMLKVDNVLFHIVVGTLLGVYVPFVLFKTGILQKISFLFKLP